MSVFEEHDGVTYENDTSYVSDGEGGLRISGSRRVAAYSRGPRGAKRYVFMGSVAELDEQIAILTRLRRHVEGIPRAVDAQEMTRRRAER